MGCNGVNIACCPEHGLHGERQECFVCGGPVEQVKMVPMDALLNNDGDAQWAASLSRNLDLALADRDERLRQIDAAYAERNAVVLAFARLSVVMGWRVGVLRDDVEPDWPVLVIDTHVGQVTWHFKADELPCGEFAPYPDPWDGHTAPEKYERLSRIGEPPSDALPGTGASK